MDHESKETSFTVILLTTLMLMGAIVAIVYEFIWFHMCSIIVAEIVVVLFFMLNWIVLCSIKIRKESLFFTSSFVSLYIAYLNWDALT